MSINIFTPLNHDHFWFYLTQFDYSDYNLIKYYATRIIKYYTKSDKYKNIVKDTILYHPEEFAKLAVEYSSHEKVITEWMLQ